MLDVAADDLAAFNGVALPGGRSIPGLPAAGLAELIWDVRRLTARQVHQISDIAKSMRQ